MKFVECSRAPGGTEVLPIGMGESFTATVSQRPDDPGGWFVDLYALFNERGSSFVKRITLGTPATRRATRVIASGSLPGAVAWKAIVKPPGAFAAKGGLGVSIACDRWPSSAGVTVLEAP